MFRFSNLYIKASVLLISSIQLEATIMNIDNEYDMAEISNHVVDLRNSDVYVPTDMSNYTDHPEGSQQQHRIHVAYLVVDTNFLLSHLGLLTDLERLLHGRYEGVYQIIIPKQVVHELDGLKSSNKRITSNNVQSSHSISTMARKAIDWCYAHFHDSKPTVTGQRLHEKIDRDALKDNSILDCCLYFQNVENGGGNMVVLLSDDKNLCVKALVNNVLTISYRSDMSASLIAGNIMSELTNNNMYQNPVQQRQAYVQPDVHSNESHYMEYGNDSADMMIEDDYYIQEQPQHQDTSKATEYPSTETIQRKQPLTLYDVSMELDDQVTTLVLEAINYAVTEVFGDEADMSGYNPETMRTLSDAANCIVRMKISTFSEFFDRRSNFNPMKTLEIRHERRKFTSVPDSIDDLRDFISFWYDFLDGIYKKRTTDQRQSLKKIYSHWESRIAQVK